MHQIFFIDYFKQAVHVSGDSFTHLQDHFDRIYTFLEHCIFPKSCIYSQSAPEDGRNCRPKHVEQA